MIIEKELKLKIEESVNNNNNNHNHSNSNHHHHHHHHPQYQQHQQLIKTNDELNENLIKIKKHNEIYEAMALEANFKSINDGMMINDCLQLNNLVMVDVVKDTESVTIKESELKSKELSTSTTTTESTLESTSTSTTSTINNALALPPLKGNNINSINIISIIDNSNDSSKDMLKTEIATSSSTTPSVTAAASTTASATTKTSTTTITSTDLMTKVYSTTTDTLNDAVDDIYFRSNDKKQQQQQQQQMKNNSSYKESVESTIVETSKGDHPYCNQLNVNKTKQKRKRLNDKLNDTNNLNETKIVKNQKRKLKNKEIEKNLHNQTITDKNFVSTSTSTSASSISATTSTTNLPIDSRSLFTIVPIKVNIDSQTSTTATKILVVEDPSKVGKIIDSLGHCYFSVNMDNNNNNNNHNNINSISNQFVDPIWDQVPFMDNSNQIFALDNHEFDDNDNIHCFLPHADFYCKDEIRMNQSPTMTNDSMIQSNNSSPISINGDFSLFDNLNNTSCFNRSDILLDIKNDPFINNNDLCSDNMTLNQLISQPCDSSKSDYFFQADENLLRFDNVNLNCTLDRITNDSIGNNNRSFYNNEFQADNLNNDYDSFLPSTNKNNYNNMLNQTANSNEQFQSSYDNNTLIPPNYSSSLISIQGQNNNSNDHQNQNNHQLNLNDIQTFNQQINQLNNSMQVNLVPNALNNINNNQVPQVSSFKYGNVFQQTNVPQSTSSYQSSIINSQPSMTVTTSQTANSNTNRMRYSSISTDRSSHDEGFGSHDDDYDDNSDNNSDLNNQKNIVTQQSSDFESTINFNQAPSTLNQDQQYAKNWIGVESCSQQETNLNLNSTRANSLKSVGKASVIDEQDESDDDDESFYGNYSNADLIGATVSEDPQNKWALNMGRSRKNSEKRFFWLYNAQSKGPKGPKMSKFDDNNDPHVLNETYDPVFASDCQIEGVKHSGKARRGDGNDLTPNPKKLLTIGLELKKLSREINSLTPINDLPNQSKNRSKKEKNKLASRACRLKKKAQHEANKIKLHGLNSEHGKLINKIDLLKNLINKCFQMQKTSNPFSNDFDNNFKFTTQYRQEISTVLNKFKEEFNSNMDIAGRTADYVNLALDKVSSGQMDGGLNDI